MTAYEIIARKRDGAILNSEEIRYFVSKYLENDIPDYQMAALLMAIFCRGMNDNETFNLTETYINSGARIDLSDVPGFKVDKHSTGGVGDKVSLLLAPIVASMGIPVPMISGRGLGHSGGTLDKLESIPGFRTQLSVEEFRRLLLANRVAMIGQTEDIVPADKRIYALRDVTATVESIPLITASIMSKKVAEGIDGLVLDVKYGNGAFMRETAQAEELAQKLIAVGKKFGLKIAAVMTSMEQPLGRKIGNWLEVEECLECFRGEGPADLLEVTLTLCAHMIQMAGAAKNFASAYQMAENSLQSGQAFQKFLKLVEAQGGDISVLQQPGRYGSARESATLNSPAEGYVSAMDTRQIGLAAVALGAGRQKADDRIDLRAGITLHKKVGDPVAKGEPILTIFADSRQKLEAGRERLERAIHFNEKAPTETPPLILKKFE